MKISELMIHLAIALQDHGDIPVLVINDSVSVGGKTTYYEVTKTEIDPTVAFGVNGWREITTRKVGPHRPLRKGEVPPKGKKARKAIVLF